MEGKLSKELQSIVSHLKELEQSSDKSQGRHIRKAIENLEIIIEGLDKGLEGGVEHRRMVKALELHLKENYGFQRLEISEPAKWKDYSFPARFPGKRPDLLGKTSNGTFIIGEAETTVNGAFKWLEGDKFRKLRTFSRAWYEAYGERPNRVFIAVPGVDIPVIEFKPNGSSIQYKSSETGHIALKSLKSNQIVANVFNLEALKSRGKKYGFDFKVCWLEEGKTHCF